MTELFGVTVKVLLHVLKNAPNEASRFVALVMASQGKAQNVVL